MANEPKLVELGFDEQVLDLINQERAKSGTKALNFNEVIDDAADRHALDMAKNNNLSETGSDGSSIASRTKDAGFASPNVGEAIAAGPMDAKQVVAQWLNDNTQRNTLLNPNFTEAALGTVAANDGKLFWAETFGGPAVAPAPAPAPAPADPMTPPVAANPMQPAQDPIKKGGGKNKGNKKMGKDPLGSTAVGDAPEFQPSKDPINGGKNPMDVKMSFSPNDYNQFGDPNNNPIVGDVKNFQPMNDPMSPPQNAMGTSDMMSTPQNAMVMH